MQVLGPYGLSIGKALSSVVPFEGPGVRDGGSEGRKERHLDTRVVKSGDGGGGCDGDGGDGRS